MDRTFKAKDRFGADMEFELLKPSLAVETEGERQFKIAYSRALAEGIFPREKLRQVMAQHGMWTEDDNKTYNTILGRITLLQIQLDKAERSGDQEKCKEIAQEVAEEREKMWKLFLIQQSVFTNSAEGLAELIKTEAIMAACTVIKSTQKRYWKNYSEFVQERDENKTSSVYQNLVTLQNKVLDGLRQQIEDKYPESKYLDSDKNIMDRMIKEEVQAEISKRKGEIVGNQAGDQADQAESDTQATPGPSGMA
jgi:hypothetical protein